jgi:hypothetical protein
MTDETEEPQEAEAKGPQRVIEGGVAAAAGDAGVAINQPQAIEPVRFCVREVVHHRYGCHPDTGQELERHSLIEYEVISGTPPDKWSTFKGLGMLRAQTPPPPMGMGNVQREYRFNIHAETIEEAWEKFEDFNKRGAAQAEESFRREFAQWSQNQQQRLAVVQDPRAVQHVLGPDGTPAGG